MVKEEILEGLKVALAKGQSLRSAMMSFYNAGYLKEEIEEAATIVYTTKISSTPTQTTPQQVNKPTTPTQTSQTQTQSPGQISYRPEQKVKPLTQKPKKVIQRVSEYEESPNKLGTAITIILVSLLLILLGVLAVIFLFKDEILVLLNKLFGL